MKKYIFAIGLMLATVATVALPLLTRTAQAQADGFSLQVSPSPLVATVKPGQTTTLELNIRNSGTTAQELKIVARGFTLNNETGEVNIDENTPLEISDWITFSEPTFVVEPGQTHTEKVTLSLPESTGFSYQFAIVIDQKEAPMASGTRNLAGSVAVFTLINVDQPGATRKLDLVQIEASQKVYEYLPATIKVKFKNTGNSIVQPYGNIFIQHGSNDQTPLATLPVNDAKGYILPGATRAMEAKWDAGFPVITANAEGKNVTQWDWIKIGNFRIGQYTAKLVGVYNDGERDVPIEAEITFWVIPWKIILGFLTVGIFVTVGLWSFIRKLMRLIAGKKDSGLKI